MSKVVHFEIHAKDMDRLEKFYKDVFGWEFQKMGEDLGGYRVIVTGPKDDIGINGGLTQRSGEVPPNGMGVNSFISIIGVKDIDETISKLEVAGASVQLPKAEVPTVGQLAYYKDPEGNLFGIIQPLPM